MDETPVTLPSSLRKRMDARVKPAHDATRTGSANAQSDAAARARRLFGHRRPAAAETAWRRADRVLDHRQSGSVGHRQTDGAPGAPRADRPADAARRAELELARIRHARRGVALLRPVRAVEHPPDALDQCARLRGL